MGAEIRRFRTLSVCFVLTAIVLLGFAAFEEARAEELRVRRIAGELSDYSAEVSARRVVGFCRAGLVLGCVLYALVLGVLFLPRRLRLVSGNLAVLLALLVLVDAATSLLGLHVPAIGRPGEAGDFGLWVYDETKGWFHGPSAAAVSYLGGPDAGHVRINRLGLRGGEIEPKSPGLTRVLVFGDSYVFGVGVDEEHLLTTHLRRRLEAHFPSGVDVVNMGVSGYSTDQEYILWKELGAGLGPDFVILVVCDNDYVGNTENFAWRRYYKPFFEADDELRLTLRNVPVPQLTRLQRAKLWLGQESNLWNLAARRKPDHPLMRAVVDSMQVDVSRPPRQPHRTMRALLKAWSAEASALGARFLVTSTGRRAEDPALFQNLAGFLEGEGIDHLDMFPVLHQARVHEPDRHWDFPEDTHWNRDAHELVAESLFELMRDRYLEPR